VRGEREREREKERKREREREKGRENGTRNRQRTQWEEWRSGKGVVGDDDSGAAA